MDIPIPGLEVVGAEKILISRLFFFSPDFFHANIFLIFFWLWERENRDAVGAVLGYPNFQSLVRDSCELLGSF